MWIKAKEHETKATRTNEQFIYHSLGQDNKVAGKQKTSLHSFAVKASLETQSSISHVSLHSI